LCCSFTAWPPILSSRYLAQKANKGIIMNKNLRNGANWALKKTCTFDGKLCADFYECLDVRLSNNTARQLIDYHNGKTDGRGNEYNILAEICKISKRQEKWDALCIKGHSYELMLQRIRNRKR
jgi:hypothetical protein